MNEMLKKPLVSIIIPVYNGENYLKEAIDSALSQTYENIEILVVNDGSFDATEKIALSYGDKIRYFKKENGGVSSAINLGIKNMRGEYFSWLSHDDKYAPDKIMKQVERLSGCHDKPLIAMCAVRYIDKNSDFLRLKKSKAYDEKKYYLWSESLIDILKVGSYNGCSLLIPKAVFECVGDFNEKMRYTQDLLMWIKIFLKGYGMVVINDALVYSRVHEKQLTQTGINIFHSDCSLMDNEIFDDLTEKSEKSNDFLFYYARYNAKYNNPEIALKCIKRAKEKKLFSVFNLLSIIFLILYGRIRPFLRKIYYKIFKKVKT